jgi:hypothetical protein
MLAYWTSTRGVRCLLPLALRQGSWSRPPSKPLRAVGGWIDGFFIVFRSPGGRRCGHWPARCGAARASVHRLVVLRRVGRREKLDVTLVESELAVEVGVDVARAASGRWEHRP